MAKGNNKGPTGDYPVGFCRPPKNTRWVRGQSGNPKGRKPEGSLDMLEALLRALKHKVSRPVDSRNMTAMEGVMYKLVGEALRGVPSAMRQLVGMMKLAEAVDQDEVVIEATLVFDEEENLLMKRSQEARAYQERIAELEALVQRLSGTAGEESKDGGV